MGTTVEISDSDLGFETKETEYRARTAARAILLDKEKIAILHAKYLGIYKLPGGGVDSGETIQQALIREVLEETGCTIDIIREVGEIIEHRSHIGLVHTSHCFLAEVVKKGEPKFTEKEINEGFELIWTTVDEALSLMKKPVDGYRNKFMAKRDLLFLEKGIEFI